MKLGKAHTFVQVSTFVNVKQPPPHPGASPMGIESHGSVVVVVSVFVVVVLVVVLEDDVVDVEVELVLVVDVDDVVVLVVVDVVVLVVVDVVVASRMHWLPTQLLSKSQGPHSIGTPHPSSMDPHCAPSDAHDFGAQQTPNLSVGCKVTQTPLRQLLPT